LDNITTEWLRAPTQGRDNEPLARRVRPKVGFVLSGGGSRGAYEAGIIHYIRTDLAKQLGRHVPIDIVTGTSVGAINAAFLAATMHDPDTQSQQIVATTPRSLVVRITNVFDIGFEDRNFVHRCVVHLRDRRALIVPSDQLATPAYATWLAEQTVTLIARGKFVWAASGFAYASAALLASILVRQDLVNGCAALMFVLLVVWATDIGGYFAGRGIGGPKLWPRVSPKKTWSGALGGFAASLLVAVAFAACGVGKIVPLLLVSAVLSIVSACGDLFESAVKRRFDVKDSSHLIPGHGGLLDRLDGFVAAILVAWIIGFLRHGVHSAGSGLMVW